MEETKVHLVKEWGAQKHPRNGNKCMLMPAAVGRVCLVQFHSGVHNFAGDLAMFNNDDKNLNR